MITRDSEFAIDRIPLHKLRVYEHQQRYPETVVHYAGKIRRDPTDDPGFILVKPRDGGYEILDGHHRFCALIIEGRPDALCIIIEEPARIPA